MVRNLYDRGFMGMPEMHRWHCTCDDCSFYSGWLFRAQTDSSCSGEVITSILHHDPEDERFHPDVFDILQDAALETDSEPGMAAGLHVHVGIGHLSARQMDDAFRAFWTHERMLVELARGRFPRTRGGNEMVRDVIDLDGWDSVREARIAHQQNDRHNNLNMNTGHDTWEFRLWNSTRSAWRLEMFTRLSVALVDPGVVALMLEDDDCSNLDDVLLDAGHERCAELVHRQFTYNREVWHTAPSTLTNL